MRPSSAGAKCLSTIVQALILMLAICSVARGQTPTPSTEQPPVNIAGTWKVVMAGPQGGLDVEFTLFQNGSTWGGSGMIVVGEVAISDGTIHGNRIAARGTLKFTGSPLPGDIEAVVEGNTIRGTVVPDNRGLPKLTFYGERTGGPSGSSGSELSRLALAARSGSFTPKDLTPEQTEKLGRINQMYQDAWVLYVRGTEESIREARKKFIEAQEFFLEIGDMRSAASTIILSERVSFDLGEFASSYQYLQRALEIWRRIGDHEWEIRTLSALAVTEGVLGDDERALQTLLTAQEIARKYRKNAKDRTAEAEMVGNIGSAYLWLGKTKKALKYYTKALEIDRETGNRVGAASLMNSIGRIYVDMGRYHDALELHEKALAIMTEMGNLIGEASTISCIARVQWHLGEKEKSMETFRESLARSRLAGHIPGQAVTLQNMMVTAESAGDLPLAIFYGKQSVNSYQQLRQNIRSLDRKTRENYVRSVERAYRRLADIMISAGRLAEAQTVLDLLKEEEFGGILRRSGGLLPIIPYSGTEAAALGVLEKLASLGRERGQLDAKNRSSTLSDKEKERYRELAALMETAEHEFNKWLQALVAEKARPQSFDDQVAGALMRDLRQLGRGTVALYTVLAESASIVAEDDRTRQARTDNKASGWIVLVTPEYRKAYPINVQGLERSVFAFRELLKSDIYDPQRTANELYKRLFQAKGADGRTLEADLDEYMSDKPERTLMWSLDGVLRYLPMTALHDGKEYLVQKYRMTVFNPAGTLSLMQPVKPNWTALGLGVSQAREEAGKAFPEIKGALRELQTIVRENDGDEGIFPGKIRVDNAFTAAAMQDALMFDRDPVVHIASHFSFDPADFEASFLLLGQGRITVRELMAKSGLFADVDLLALSACDTAVGTGNGKDIEGLAYAAQALGAKAVIATLWPVADTGTDELMIRFYEIRQSDPTMPKAEALRRAQISLLRGDDSSVGQRAKNIGNAVATRGWGGDAGAKDRKTLRSEIVRGKKQDAPLYDKLKNPPYAHPFYWAPFVLFGNWK
jgi:CHAT domain-containing protein/Tfp pilus assembly protein PilF